MKKELEGMIQTRKKEIAKLEKSYAALVGSSSRVEAYRLSQTVSGLGPKLARVLSAELPNDLQEWSSKHVYPLVGVAPLDSASGRTVRHSRTG